MLCLEWIGGILALGVIFKVVDWLLRLPKLGLSTKTKNILVTGCDTGFGHLFAKRMDKKGFCVFAGCLTDEGIKTLTETCSSQMKAFKLNVANEESVESAVEFVKSKLSKNEGLWAIVNNAGITGTIGQTSWMSRKDYDTVLNVNFHGVRHMCEAFLPLLLESRGRIVNTASVLGRISSPTMAPYCVTKYAVEAFSDALRRDVGYFGVGVHIIEPGMFMTCMMDVERIFDSFKNCWSRQPTCVQQRYGDDYPQAVIAMGRVNMAKQSTRVDLVADAYEHAILAVYPRVRYLVGWDARLLYCPLSLVHGWVCDVFLRRNQIAPKGRTT